jgi:Right handed beta helix region
MPMEVVKIGFAAALMLAIVVAVRTPTRVPETRRLFVALDGRDSWSGKLAAPNRQRTDGPFATLERARDEVRGIKAKGGLPPGGVTVEVRGGTYERERPFELTAADSGSATAPVVYRAAPGEEVRLIGGKVVTGFRPVTDAAVLERLEPAARGKVLQADLRAQGVTEFGSVKGGGLELFFQDRPMTVARWPNEGFVRIVDVTGGDPVNVRGTKGDKIGKFTYEGDRPTRWAGEKEVWLHGYWFWDWSDEREKVAAIDTTRREISLAPPYHSYGYRKGQWYYAFNLLSELDQPGEWYLDREIGILYFWPPASITSGHPTVSVLSTLVTLHDTSYVTLRGMTLEAVRGTAVTITGGAHSQVVGCTMRDIGGWAVKVAGGEGHAVVGCDITATGEGGIALAGGDRKTLTPAGHLAENNHIHHYSRWNRMYQPAIALNGVGNRAVHNLIHDAPHEAIAFSGNDHVIELNEIHHVCEESNDAGAIYSGRDWTMRGTVIRHNYLHHIQGFEGRGCVGIYLDDMFCGTQITGNVFYQVTRAAFIGGGRDNVVENNIFVECKPALHVDARALGWAADSVPSTMTERLRAMPYRDALWRTCYTKLVSVLDDEPAAPRGNRVAHNISQGGRWDEIEAKARPLVTLEENLVDQDVHFVDAARMNFQLRDDSPAYRMGFQRIPFDKIGLYRDERRASWPVGSFRDSAP